MSLTTEHSRPGLEEVLALDQLCLLEPDGGPLDAVVHRERIDNALSRSEWGLVRRVGALVAYGYLWPAGGSEWFVGGLAIHPQHRSSPTVAALGKTMGLLLTGVAAKRLKSHVLRTNTASLRLHRRLGFTIEQENDNAVAFAADCATLLATLRV